MFSCSVLQACEQFDWGGCNGVVPFQTESECRNARCNNACTQIPETGFCKARFIRWYFDNNSGVRFSSISSTLKMDTKFTNPLVVVTNLFYWLTFLLFAVFSNMNRNVLILFGVVVEGLYPSNQRAIARLPIAFPRHIQNPIQSPLRSAAHSHQTQARAPTHKNVGTGTPKTE